MIFTRIDLSLHHHRRDEYNKATFKGCWKGAQQKWILVDMHVPPPWDNKLLFLPKVKNQRKELPLTDYVTALVKRVIELCQAKLEAYHYVEEFYLWRIHPLVRRKKLAYDPRMVDPSRDPTDGNIFILSFQYR
jgi:hypothetical protein